MSKFTRCVSGIVPDHNLHFCFYRIMNLHRSTPVIVRHWKWKAPTDLQIHWRLPKKTKKKRVFQLFDRRLQTRVRSNSIFRAITIPYIQWYQSEEATSRRTLHPLLWAWPEWNIQSHRKPLNQIVTPPDGQLIRSGVANVIIIPKKFIRASRYLFRLGQTTRVIITFAGSMQRLMLMVVWWASTRVASLGSAGHWAGSGTTGEIVAVPYHSASLLNKTHKRNTGATPTQKKS